jgi:excisionase family DNA binding protein
MVSLLTVLTVSEAALRLGVSAATMRRWAKAGVFPGTFRTRGGHYRLLAYEVDRLRAGVRQ